MYENKKSASKAQSLYVTLVVLLMSVAVIVAIGGAVAKNTKKNTPPIETEQSETTVKAGEKTEKKAETTEKKAEDAAAIFEEKKEETTAAETTAAPVESEPTAAEPAPVVYSAPCNGALIKGYSATVPVFSNTMEDWRTHKGVDIYAECGSPVQAAASGVISQIWSDPMMGKCLSITHVDGAVTTYANLQEELPTGIEKDAAVNGGDVIAAVGETALCEIAEEPHLHFEMTVQGVAVNPDDYMDFGSETAGYEG